MGFALKLLELQTVLLFLSTEMVMAETIIAGVNDLVFYLVVAFVSLTFIGFILLLVVLIMYCRLGKRRMEAKRAANKNEDGMVLTNQFALPLPRRDENLYSDYPPEQPSEYPPRYPPSATSPGYWENFQPQSKGTRFRDEELQNDFMDVIILDASKIRIPRAQSHDVSNGSVVSPNSQKAKTAL